LPTLIDFLMTKFFFKTLMTVLVVIASAAAFAQSPAPTASATASDVAALREQVQALTETVKALQQQVKDQQTLLEKANIAGNQSPQGEGTPSMASVPVPTPLPGASAQGSFPTTDSSVVANAPTAPGAIAPIINCESSPDGIRLGAGIGIRLDFTRARLPLPRWPPFLRRIRCRHCGRAIRHSPVFI
jgi:type II secretory pathway pseudopilin PulG